jgi:hypothetical protein
MHLWWLQEAVVDVLQEELEGSFVQMWKPRSWVQILRGVRLGSLMHGIPEAIPLCHGQPLFPRCSPARDPCQATAVWVCDNREMQSPMYTTTCALWRLRRHTFPACATRAFVVEGPQLELGHVEVARQLKKVKKKNKKEKGLRDAGSEAALMSMEVVLRAAIENAEPVVVRKWWKVPKPVRPRTALARPT